MRKSLKNKKNCEKNVQQRGHFDPKKRRKREKMVRNGPKLMAPYPSHLKDQRPLRLISGLSAKMFDLIFVTAAEIVKTQAVFFGIHNFT